MKKTFLIMAVGLFAVPLVAGATALDQQGIMAITGVKAQLATQNSNNSSTPAKVLQKAVAGAIDRCPMIESRIQMKIGDFDNNKIRHMEAYSNMKERLSKISDRLSEKGADVSGLKEDLAVLDSKISKFSADYAIYIGKLKEAQGFVCGKSKGQFLAKLKESRVALKEVHQDSLEIRAYYVSTIKPELQRIKRILDGNKATTSPEISSSTAGGGPTSTAPAIIE